MTAPEFLVARNPEEDSKLPYLLRLPIDGGLVLKARDTWPRSSRVYCHRFEEGWPADAEVLDRATVISCRRRGPAIDLVLNRPRLPGPSSSLPRSGDDRRSSGRPKRTARSANPGARVPRRRALTAGFTVWVDTRERYPYRFAGRKVHTERVALPAGDYAVRSDGGAILAAVERKGLVNLASCLSDGTLSFQMQRLAELPLAAVVVEGRYSGLHRLEHVSGGWLADVLTRLQVRYAEVQVVFADTRAFAEDWTYRFLAAAIADATADPFEA